MSEKYQKNDSNAVGEFSEYSPREAYSNVPLKSLPFLKNYFNDGSNSRIFTEGDPDDFNIEKARTEVSKHLGNKYENYGFSDDISINCFERAAVVSEYRTQLCDLSHLKNIQFENKIRFYGFRLFRLERS